MRRSRGTAGQALFAATVGNFLGLTVIALFGPTVNQFEQVVPMTPALAGLLVAVPSLSGSLLRIPCGAWTDSGGGRKPFLLVLGLSLIGLIGLLALIWPTFPGRLTADDYPLLLLFGLLAGSGIASFSVAVGQLYYWFPASQHGRALGITAGAANVAPGLLTFLVPVSLLTLGMTGTYLAWVLLLTGGILVLYFMLRAAPYFQLREQGMAPIEARLDAAEEGETLFPPLRAGGTLVAAARIWQTWALAGVYFSSFGAFVALTAWFPTYWTKFFGFDLVTAGMLAAAFSILTSLLHVAGGWLADHLGGLRTAVGATSVTLVAATALTFSFAPPLSVVGALLMAAGIGISSAAVFKMVSEVIRNAVGGASGWIGGLGVFGGFVFPPILGVFVAALGQDGYARGFVVFIAFAGMSLALLLGPLRRQDRLPLKRD